MICEMIKNNNGCACNLWCDSFRGNSETRYSPEYGEEIFEIHCESQGYMTFSATTGERLGADY